MESPTKLLSSPTKALNPLSPERINQQQPPPQSPSQSADIFNLHRKSATAASDVQSKVAFLNNLSRTGSPAGAPQQSASAAAALQRAILGREEAESALSKASAQLSEAQSRERRISERLESLLEELQASKERKAHERTIFEKEIRKARKEAFRAGSTLVKTQEDLKEARAEAKGFKEELEVERKSKDKAKQEAFERAYAIAGLTEELEELKARLRAAEAKNNADPLKLHDRALRKEEGSRVSLAEGDLALLATPASRRPKRSADYLADFPSEDLQETPTKQTPPKRLRLSDVTPTADKTVDPQEPPKQLAQAMVEKLKISLRLEKQLRENAEGLAEFLRMECQFRRCSCRIVEELDNVPAQAQIENASTEVKTENGEKHNQAPTRQTPNMELLDSSVPDQLPPVQHFPKNDSSAFQSIREKTPPPVKQAPVGLNDDSDEPLITFSPITGTFQKIPSPVRSAKKHPFIPPMSPVESAKRQPTSPLAKYEITQEEEPAEDFEAESAVRAPVRFSPTPAHTSRDHRPPMMEAPKREPKKELKKELKKEPKKEETVKRVPLKKEGSMPDQSTTGSGTPISREAALAQIKARRNRANTTKRSASAMETSRRAPGTSKPTTSDSARRIPGVHNPQRRSETGDMRSRRDLSAPIRLTHRR
ncbi:hypothetical protein P170DRAFT_410851 [Aspergillus steynii IBT 23096]|uniref:Uncharacterized protein n=1 Tax=Aspergillus steynii IBT 23096 TaxID=1392250 RepID=A0A2I2G5L1_9EURO|nr:uncharacterized protein P170DRAFT_410851 [Aspergillus steynii IBT 23096]PLB48165.1 hypothetical protein P170DRAFT_410851 [Aspergillus steynii IBT 23096]